MNITHFTVLLLLKDPTQDRNATNRCFFQENFAPLLAGWLALSGRGFIFDLRSSLIYVSALPIYVLSITWFGAD